MYMSWKYLKNIIIQVRLWNPKAMLFLALELFELIKETGAVLDGK